MKSRALSVTLSVRFLPVTLVASLAMGIGAILSTSACDTETATSTTLENDYPLSPDGSTSPRGNVVYRAWWVVTYFPDPVSPQTTSTEQRTVPATDFAYALMARDWDPASTAPPTSFVALKSKAPLSVKRGDVLTIKVDDVTFAGNCAAQQPLSQADADFITASIFPGEFTGFTYDAATCAMTAIPTDDGGVAADGSADASSATDAADGG